MRTVLALCALLGTVPSEAGEPDRLVPQVVWMTNDQIQRVDRDYARYGLYVLVVGRDGQALRLPLRYVEIPPRILEKLRP